MQTQATTAPVYGPFTIQTLTANLDKLSPRDRDFATSLLTTVARLGHATPKMAPHLAKLAARATGQEPRPQGRAVGTLDGLKALFDRAASHLKRPAITLQTPEGFGFRLSPASAASRNPGAIYVKAEGEYLGKVSPAGEWFPARDVTHRPGVQAIAGVLEALSRDPEGTARAYGRLTGACCFCAKALTDARSTSVGYGPVCAGHYGLPWGEA